MLRRKCFSVASAAFAWSSSRRDSRNAEAGQRRKSDRFALSLAVVAIPEMLRRLQKLLPEYTEYSSSRRDSRNAEAAFLTMDEKNVLLPSSRRDSRNAEAVSYQERYPAALILAVVAIPEMLRRMWLPLGPQAL